MTHPLWALRRAIHARLAGDAELGGLLGGPRVYEEPPRGAQPPYVVFGEATSRDWSDTSGAGHEHTLTLLVWSGEPGVRQALRITERIAALLDDAELGLAGHRLVNLRLTSQELKREGRPEPMRRVSLKLRAVTEAL